MKVTTYNINNEAVITKVILLKLDDDLAKQACKNYILNVKTILH